MFKLRFWARPESAHSVRSKPINVNIETDYLSVGKIESSMEQIVT